MSSEEVKETRKKKRISYGRNTLLAFKATAIKDTFPGMNSIPPGVIKGTQKSRNQSYIRPVRVSHVKSNIIRPPIHKSSPLEELEQAGKKKRICYDRDTLIDFKAIASKDTFTGMNSICQDLIKDSESPLNLSNRSSEEHLATSFTLLNDDVFHCPPLTRKSQGSSPKNPSRCPSLTPEPVIDDFTPISSPTKEIDAHQLFTIEFVQNIFEEFKSTSNKDYMIDSVCQDFPGENIIEFVYHLFRQMREVSEENLKCAGAIIKELIMQELISIDHVMLVLTEGVIFELPNIEVYGPKFIPYLDMFMLELVTEEPDLSWLLPLLVVGYESFSCTQYTTSPDKFSIIIN